jgi:hypothetical protein
MQALILTPAANEQPTSSFATLDTRNVHPILAFTQGGNLCTVFSDFLPASYGGNGLTNTIVWAAVPTTGNVTWSVAYEALAAEALAPGSQDIDSDGFASAVSSSATAVPGTSGQLAYTDIATTSGAQMDSLAAGQAFRIKLCRTDNDAGGDAQALRLVITETP